MGSDFEHQSMLAMPFALEVARCLVRMSKRQPPRGRNATAGWAIWNLDSELHNAMQGRRHGELNLSGPSHSLAKTCRGFLRASAWKTQKWLHLEHQVTLAMPS